MFQVNDANVGTAGTRGGIDGSFNVDGVAEEDPWRNGGLEEGKVGLDAGATGILEFELTGRVGSAAAPVDVSASFRLRMSALTRFHFLLCTFAKASRASRPSHTCFLLGLSWNLSRKSAQHIVSHFLTIHTW